MATYNYHCNSCGEKFSVWRKPSESTDKCQHCSSKDIKQIYNNQGGFILKGRGWFNKGGY